MFTKKKPLVFTKPSTKPDTGTVSKDVENKEDAKMPGDKAEDSKSKKKKGKGASFWAGKAAAGVAGK